MNANSKRQWSRGLRGEDALYDYGKLYEHRPDLLDIKMLGKYTTKAKQEKFGDFQVLMDGKKLNVDAKVENLRSEFFPIELVQDVATSNAGWFHKLTGCDAIWLAQIRDDPPANKYGLWFYSIWRISLPRLRLLFDTHGGSWRTITTHRGYGETKCALAPLAELERHNVVKHWWGERYKGPTIIFPSQLPVS